MQSSMTQAHNLVFAASHKTILVSSLLLKLMLCFTKTRWSESVEWTRAEVVITATPGGSIWAHCEITWGWPSQTSIFFYLKLGVCHLIWVLASCYYLQDFDFNWLGCVHWGGSGIKKNQCLGDITKSTTDRFSVKAHIFAWFLQQNKATD